MNRQDKESTGKVRHEVRAVIAAWQQHALAVSLTPESYSTFGDRLLALARMVWKDLDDYRKQELHQDKQLLLADNAMIIQDGCAELFADWQDGVDCEVLRARLLYHQGIWFNQLHFKE